MIHLILKRNFLIIYLSNKYADLIAMKDINKKITNKGMEIFMKFNIFHHPSQSFGHIAQFILK